MTKADFDARLSSLNRKIIKNKADHLIVKNELNKLKTFDWSYYNGKSYFEEDGKPNYLIFQPLNKYFKLNDSSFHNFLSWTFKGWSIESIKPPTTPNNNLTPNLYYQGTKTIVSFPGACLRQDKVTFNHGKIVNIYIVYKLIKLSNIYKNNNLTIENALFGAVSLTKNADVDNINILDMGLHLIKEEVFHFQVVDMVKM